MAFKFENLEVWKDSLELSVLVNEVVIDFPREEVYVLTSQIKRAADSVSLNIAEGSTGQSNREFGKFLGYAIRSAIEVVACIYLAQKRNIIKEDNFKKVYSASNDLVKKLQALRKKVYESETKPKRINRSPNPTSDIDIDQYIL